MKSLLPSLLFLAASLGAQSIPSNVTATPGQTGNTVATNADVVSATAGGPVSYVKNFPSSMSNAFLLTEGTGGTVTDAIGGQTASTIGTATWSTDKGGLVFSGGFANRFEATGITSMQGLEVCEVSSLPTSQQFNMPLAYAGPSTGGSSTVPVVVLETDPAIGTSNNGAANQPTFAAFHINPTVADVTGATIISPGRVTCHTLSYSPGSTPHLYINGVEQINYSSTVTPTATPNSGYIEFGGTPLGAINCSTTYCGYNGTIYGVAVYSTAPTLADAQRSYQNWLKILSAKGVNINQFTATHNGLGAQNTSGKAVQIIGHGESNTWGHGLSTPATQNYIYASSTTVNAGVAFGYAGGTDSSSAYLMQYGLNLLLAQRSPIAQNVDVLMTNANDCKSSSGAGVTFSSNQASSAAQALISMANQLEALGDLVLIGTGTSGTYGTGDTGKDQCNPALRAAAINAGKHLWDIASWTALGADGASSSATYYQSDHTHWLAATHTTVGANLGGVINRLLYAAPVTTTAATYSMTGQEDPLFTNPSTNSQTITLPDCIGQSKTTVPIRILNLQTSGANTLTVQGLTTLQAENINGASSIVIANSSSRTFTAYNLGDASAGCGWTAQ